MRLRFLLPLAVAFVSIEFCRGNEDGDPTPQNLDEIEAPRRHEIVFPVHKEETTFEVKSTTARKSSRPSATTTARPSARPTATTTVSYSTTRGPNRNKFTRRTTTQTTPTTAAAIVTSSTPAVTDNNATHAEISESADRLNANNEQNAPESLTAADDRNCNCIQADHCPTVTSRIVTPEGECPQENQVYCCFSPHTSPPPTCGIRPNISLPEVALKPGQAPFAFYPWNAAVLDVESNVFLGGGVLLDNFHVLTAAHKINTTYLACLDKIKVRLGEWDAGGSSEPHHHQDFSVSEITINPEYNRKNLRSDLAILTLSKPIALRRSPHIAAACVPPLDKSFVGHRCWVSGWGKNAFGPDASFQPVLKHTDVPIIDSDECETRLRDTKLSQYFQLHRKSFICAGGEPEKDACTGDGGSPLVCESSTRPNQFYVVGLVAWGIGCATSGVPGVYVNVAGHSDWIAEVTSNLKSLGH